MPYVVTQSCCADAACVVACPVNCIHPAPGEPGFAEAEMLFIDPASCVGCGACATACPVGAVVPHTSLTDDQQPFQALNAEYFEAFPHADRTPVAVVPKQRRLRRPGPFRVAVVGAGPAGMHTADALLAHPEISVDVHDRLPTPYGLVRAGVAPDHEHTKQVTRRFAQIEDLPGFSYRLDVEVGRDVSHAELRAAYDAVVYTVGASEGRRLEVPGEDLRGSITATEITGWYNGHPDRQDLEVPLDHERAVVVGTGNVALDVARVLTADPEALSPTAVARLPWTALMRSRVREVVLLGRRGAEHAAFTVPELIGLAGLRDIDVEVDTGGAPIEGDDVRSRLLRELAERPARPGRRRIVLRFDTRVVEVLGEGGVEAVVVERDGRRERLETGLLVASIGFRARPVPDLPFDEIAGVVPHQRGRVEPGVYVAGWIKRGPRGFIGTNLSCAAETVESLLDDLDAGAAAPAMSTPLPRGLGLDAWRRIDAEERRRGAVQGRARATIVDRDELRRVAAGPEPVQRYAALRRWTVRSGA